MAYPTLMAHLDVGSPNEGVLRVVASLAARFRAKVIGIAACQPMPVMYSDGSTSADMVQTERAEMVKETREAEASFRTALQGTVAALEWRSVIANEQLADYVAREARAADLVITGPDQGWSAFDTTRRVVISNLVLKAGRPVVIVPPDADGLTLDSVVVAWKETREARRAIIDALPILKEAGHVVVVEITAAADVEAARKRLADVAAWLDRHGVASECSVAASMGDDAAQLGAVARDKRAGLIVAGAFGHNRLREWVLGGVTRNLMVHPSRCSFVAY